MSRIRPSAGMAVRVVKLNVMVPIAPYSERARATLSAANAAPESIVVVIPAMFWSTIVDASDWLVIWNVSVVPAAEGLVADARMRV